jgi:hypothetical protein
MAFSSAPFGLILLGLTLGMRHATDPDHVIAVTAILTRERRLFSAMRIGLVWGLGHSATVMAAGTAIIFFKLKVPARLGLSFEFTVAIVLILLGLGAAKKTLAFIARRLGLPLRGQAILMVHAHRHSHEGRKRPHTHHHVHAHWPVNDGASASHDHFASLNPSEAIAGRSSSKSFAVGLVHGLAGSAAIALLVTAAIPSPWWATLYMAIFCCGVVIGMLLITAAVGGPFVFAARNLVGFHRKLSLAAGCLSFGFGLFIAYQIAVVNQLFGATPAWFPH